ncbi:MAG: hypothetical protein IKX03_02260, partial [Bacteroidales bacterium]|nr:hypothetical protein [Bacteroidales bacterium]
VIKGLASAWKEAQERAQEYAESLKWAEDFNARADKMRHGAGEDANPEAAEALQRDLQARFRRSEVILQNGGQPIYDYVIILS